MKHVIKGLVLFFALVLQNAFGANLEILGIKPSLLIVCVIAFSLSSENIWEALVYGLAAGILYDIFWGRVYGVMTVLMMYTGVGVYYAGEFLYKKTVTEAVAITFLATVVIEALFYGANFALFGDARFVYVLLRIIIPAAAYNAIFQAVFYHMLHKVSSKRGESA